jgi:hypothetical protein
VRFKRNALWNLPHLHTCSVLAIDNTDNLKELCTTVDRWVPIDLPDTRISFRWNKSTQSSTLRGGSRTVQCSPSTIPRHLSQEAHLVNIIPWTKYILIQRTNAQHGRRWFCRSDPVLCFVDQPVYEHPIFSGWYAKFSRVSLRSGLIR